MSPIKHSRLKIVVRNHAGIDDDDDLGEGSSPVLEVQSIEVQIYDRETNSTIKQG